MPDEFAELRPTFRVFLSADIVGSTAFKQPFDRSSLKRSLEQTATWQRAVSDFYLTMERGFLDSWEGSRLHAGTEGLSERARNVAFGKTPVFWKTVGDEIIFWKEVDHELQLIPLLDSWLKAIEKCREKFQTGAGTNNLDVKCVIWGAEFPIRNKEMVRTRDRLDKVRSQTDSSPIEVDGVPSLRILDEDELAINAREEVLNEFNKDPEEQSSKVDFIGPGIDIGFRLGSLPSPKKMAISVDIAFLLSVCFLVWDSRDEKSAPESDRIKIPKWIKQDSEIWRFMQRSFYFPERFSTEGNFQSGLKLHFSGTQFMKGVLGGIAYPFFWINTLQKDSLKYRQEQLYLEKRDGLSWDKVYKYCLAYYEDRQKFVAPPIVSLRKDWALFCPKNYTKEYENLLKIYKEIQKQQRAKQVA